MRLFLGLLLAFLFGFGFLQVRPDYDYLNDNVNVVSTSPDDVRFYLYRDSAGGAADVAEELDPDNATSIQASRFNASLGLILLVHGYTQNHTSAFPVNVRTAYLEAGFGGTWNLVTVDWGRLCTPKDNAPVPLMGNLLQLTSYRQAMDHVPLVGRRISRFLRFLSLAAGWELAGKVHMVGHSLGAHVCGTTGLFYRQETGVRLYRITGSDPANPGYQHRHIDDKLDASDAAFVDIVHTDQGKYGEYAAIGTVDFYVNGGGPSHSDCSSIANPTQSSCSHNLAPLVFAKSILTDSIKACPQSHLPVAPSVACSQPITFGQFCPLTARGSYGFTFTLNSTNQRI